MSNPDDLYLRVWGEHSPRMVAPSAELKAVASQGADGENLGESPTPGEPVLDALRRIEARLTDMEHQVRICNHSITLISERLREEERARRNVRPEADKKRSQPS